MDVLAVGPRAFFFRLECRGGLLIPTSSRPPEAYSREMTDLGSVCTAVSGWREAVVLRSRRPAQILAVHRRILYGSENRLWDLVSHAMGEGWGLAQSAALGLNEEPFEETCQAALRLYGLAADEAHSLLNERQQRVVRYARELSGLADR